MTKYNEELTSRLKKMDIKKYEVSDEIGLSNNSQFSALLRYDPTPEFEKQVEEAIERLQNKKAGTK
jgi:hypothetical protein